MYCSNEGINYFFNIDIGVEELNIKLCRWDGTDDHVEENFELTLVPITTSDLADISSLNSTFVGNYSYEKSSLKKVLGRSLVCVLGCEREYGIKRCPIGVIMHRISGSKIFKKIDLSKIPYDITLNDLSNKTNRNRLIRGRKRY